LHFLCLNAVSDRAMTCNCHQIVFSLAHDRSVVHTRRRFNVEPKSGRPADPMTESLLLSGAAFTPAARAVMMRNPSLKRNDASAGEILQTNPAGHCKSLKGW